MRIEDLYQTFLKCGSVSIDTRNIKVGSIYFSLRGSNFNGNEFAEDALGKGAEYAVIDDKRFIRNEKTIYVNDSLKALQDLAIFHRRNLKIPVIGITGSNGKTTTKELMCSVLSNKFNTVATVGNFNNHIGVPLTILAIQSQHEMAIVEMGANHVGEICLLCNIANPTHGLITNIGSAHVGSFGSFENIVTAKMELFHHLVSNKGTAFINANSSVLTDCVKSLKFNHSVFYPNTNTEYPVQLVDYETFIAFKTPKGVKIKTKIVGSYNFENILAATCVGKYFNIPEAQIYKSVATYSPNNMRSQLIESGSNKIILDVYNANPSSMQMAIENFVAINAKRKVVILGDMFELGKDADEEHIKIVALLNKSNLENVYLCGPLMARAQTQCPTSKSFKTIAELEHELKKNPIQNSTILMKGSRGMALEKLLYLLKE